MKKQLKSGFTIVELIVVVVVIGILASIAIVSYNGIQQRALNTARINELRVWEKIIVSYVAANGNFPPALAYNASVQNYKCLGKGFPVGAGGAARCRNYNSTTDSYLETDNTTLMTELAAIGKVSSSEKKPAGGVVGPYIHRAWTDLVILYVALDGRNGYQCPSGTSESYVSTDRSTLLCSLSVNL